MAPRPGREWSSALSHLAEVQPPLTHTRKLSSCRDLPHNLFVQLSGVTHTSTQCVHFPARFWYDSSPLCLRVYPQKCKATILHFSPARQRRTGCRGTRKEGGFMKKTMLKTEFREQYVYHTAALWVKDIKGRTES